MDESIGKLEQLTAHVLSRIDTIEWEELQQFIEVRGELIDQLKGQSNFMPTEGQQERIQRILSCDEIILHRMRAYKAEAEKHLSKFSTAQKTMNAYNSIYTPESHFVDKKK
ncbi:flagellar protein FliT [Paenibacillus sp. GD4]|uniref:flagellar protein FliT n=1 Tax=Paenibacillus sp. GD4 TaxID=3068890 RepID=UPI002796DF92|nr:flagellar protein FliT [Paenibacillus sp. GD4]MDQ1911300.1 flagellar protein FliT [Paenibacillus sp. GD4]